MAAEIVQFLPGDVLDREKPSPAEARVEFSSRLAAVTAHSSRKTAAAARLPIAGVTVRGRSSPTRRREPSQPCFTIGHALSLSGRAASSAGTVASSLR